MQVLDLTDIVLLCVIEDLQEIVGLITDRKVFSLLRLQDIFSEEHRIVIGTTHIRLPIAFRVVKGVDELLESLEVIEDFRILRDEVIDLLRLSFNAVEPGNQTLLNLQLTFHCCLRFFRLLLDSLNELMHELDVIFEVELPGLECLLLVLNGVFQFGGLLFLDVDVHLGEVDLLLLL